MAALVDPTEAPNATEPSTNDDDTICWRYLRLRHAFGRYCFGWRYGDDLLVFSLDAPEYQEGAPS